MEKIAIIGTGGFGREVKMLIDQINLIKPQYEIIGFYDDDESNQSKLINGIPYLGKINLLNELQNSCNIALGIGTPIIKESIINKLQNPNLKFPNLIHPSVLMGTDFVKLGKGNVICGGVIMTVNIELMDFITLNLCCTVGHDTNIESFASFMPSVNISGEVIIRSKVYVGTGAKIINQLEIGENTIVGAGAVVSKSLPSNCTAVGIPAKPIKYH